MKKLMFVIPFAGGSSQSFVAWKDVDEFAFFYVDLPGKGKNTGLPFLKSMKEMAEFCANQILTILREEGDGEYYLWGHSMGSYLAYEVIKILTRDNRLLPKKLILSGTAGPERMQREEMCRHMLCEESFLNYIVDFGLVNDKVSKSRFFQKRFLPAILNDYEVLLDYRTPKDVVSGIEVIVINGESDSITCEDAKQWSEYFEQEIMYKWVPGNHFFIFDGRKVVDEIYEEISGR